MSNICMLIQTMISTKHYYAENERIASRIGGEGLSIRNEELEIRNVFQINYNILHFLHLNYTERIILYFCVAKR